MKMNYEEAKQRSDYKFSVNIPEYLLAELKADWLNSFCENGDPERGAAVLEIGYVDIELNIFAENQVARMSDSENHRPVLNYFCCIKHGDKDDDWESDDYICETSVNWNDSGWRYQLEHDMLEKLDQYAKRKGYSYDNPN